MYYPCSENKGADQLRSYWEADLRLCFPICRLFVFPCGGSFLIPISVLDDEDSSITAGSIVTVTVTLKRTNFLDNYDSSPFEGKLENSTFKETSSVVGQSIIN